jgi:hypothetical protein
VRDPLGLDLAARDRLDHLVALQLLEGGLDARAAFQVLLRDVSAGDLLGFLITGGTSGIGLETAREFLAEGAAVAITGRSRDRLDEAARRLEGPLLTIVSDAGDAPGQAALAARLHEEWPQLDILMGNAADITHLPLEEWTEEAFDRLIPPTSSHRSS